MEFEPTVSQDPLVRFDPALTAGGAPSGPIARPLEDGLDPNAERNPPTVTKPEVPFSQTLAGRMLLILLSMSGAALAACLIYRYRVVGLMPVVLDRAFEKTGLSTPAWVRNWLRWNRLQPVEQAFAPINWSLRWLGKPPPVHATPAERAATLKQLLPLAVQPIEAAASELEIGLFTPKRRTCNGRATAGWQILLHYLRARVTTLLGL